VLGLLVLAWRRRAPLPFAYAVVAAVIAVLFVRGYTHFAPRTHFTPAELRVQHRLAHRHPQVSNEATSANESSTREHLSSLRDGARTVVHHPWGYGLGNAGVTAERTKVQVRAGESTYTELGVEVGLLGALVFVAWSLALFRSALRRRAFLGAAFAAVLFVGLQTDVIGVPWVAVSVWALAADEP
jgi:O-antigen ligase